MDKFIKDNKPDLILNFAAYTNVEDAEDPAKDGAGSWMKVNYDVNALGVYNLAKLSNLYSIDLITISTDYVFDGAKNEWYTENDAPNPINSYGMAKYLWEKLARYENSDTIIIRTSWLYGGWGKFKNFVNTMLMLSETKKELKVVNNQFGSPTYTVDLCNAIVKVIENIKFYKWKTLHFSNKTEVNGISWFEFAKEIFMVARKWIILTPCDSKEFPSKVSRPNCTVLLNWSDIQLRSWKDAINDYLKTIL